jgi:hypothetical protein
VPRQVKGAATLGREASKAGILSFGLIGKPAKQQLARARHGGDAVPRDWHKDQEEPDQGNRQGGERLQQGDDHRRTGGVMSEMAARPARQQVPQVAEHGARRQHEAVEPAELAAEQGPHQPGREQPSQRVASDDVDTEPIRRCYRLGQPGDQHHDDQRPMEQSHRQIPDLDEPKIPDPSRQSTTSRAPERQNTHRS